MPRMCRQKAYFQNFSWFRELYKINALYLHYIGLCRNFKIFWRISCNGQLKELCLASVCVGYFYEFAPNLVQTSYFFSRFIWIIPRCIRFCVIEFKLILNYIPAIHVAWKNTPSDYSIKTVRSGEDRQQYLRQTHAHDQAHQPCS